MKPRCCPFGDRAIGRELPPGLECKKRKEQPSTSNAEIENIRRSSVPNYGSMNRTLLPANTNPFFPCPIAPPTPLPFELGALIGMFFGDTRVSLRSITALYTRLLLSFIIGWSFSPLFYSLSPSWFS